MRTLFGVVTLAASVPYRLAMRAGFERSGRSLLVAVEAIGQGREHAFQANCHHRGADRCGKASDIHCRFGYHWLRKAALFKKAVNLSRFFAAAAFSAAVALIPEGRP